MVMGEEAEAKKEEVASAYMSDDEEEAEGVRPKRRKMVNKAPRRDCPYLSSINRNVLDFDFEKVCSVSLSSLNPYCCLVCGKFFQGRGKHTHAYTHAVEECHYVWMNLIDGRVYCLPDGYEVIDASMNDIKYNLNPSFSDQEIGLLSSSAIYSKALDGTDFIPGCVGLNIIQHSDYLNVIIQCFCHVIPFRNYLLQYVAPEVNGDPVLSTLSDLMRKIYNAKNFKGIVSPHEFFQAVGRASKKKFYMKQQDPLALFSWLCGHLQKNMGGNNMVAKSFEGEVLVKTAPATDETKVVESRMKTTMLTLDVPDEPLFKDNFDFIPQVPLFSLLEKFNGEKIHEVIAKGGESREIKRYSMRKLPPYQVFLIKRFRKNNFFVEKNPTVVNFPLKDLDLVHCVHPDCVQSNPETKYDLVCNIVHEGKPDSGSYKVQCLHASTQQWYEMQDLVVKPILPQMVAVTESYIQIYQRQDVQADGTFQAWVEPQEKTEDDMQREEEQVMAVDELAEAGIIIG